MVQSLRPRLTPAQKTELWRRWRRGESLNAIGRALGRIAKVVRYEVARTGGIPPAARRRSRLALTLPEREAISRGPGPRDVGATDQPPAAPGPVDGESGGTPARRAASVSGGQIRRGGLGARPATQAVSLGGRTLRCVTRWPPSSLTSGRPSRSPAGSVRRILMIRRCTYRTKRST